MSGSTELSDKVVLITGGSRGIGRACALAFAQERARVVVAYAGNEAAARETVEAIERAAGFGRAVRLDVSDTAACAQAVEEVVKDQGRLDVLVNNAGVAIDGLIMRFKDEDWDRTIDVNLRGTFAMSRAASKVMMRQRSGSIVNLTSVIGEMGNGGQSAYAASKGGIISLTKALARELSPRNIRVNAVSPGFIETDMTAGIPPEAREKMLTIIPAGRLGTAEDVANAVVFLASAKAAYITGEVLKVNGGMYM